MLIENVRNTTRVLCLFMAMLLVMGVLLPTTANATEPTETVNVVAVESNANVGWTFFWVILSIVVTAFVVKYLAYKEKVKLQKNFCVEISKFSRENNRLEVLNKSTQQELYRAQGYLQKLENWKNNAIHVYPEIENLVRNNFGKSEAEIFNSLYPNLKTAETTHENYQFFADVIQTYSTLSPEAKMQVGISLETLQQKKQKSLNDYIRVAKGYLKNADDNFKGTPENLHNLTKIMAWFNSIPAEVRSEISGTLVTSLAMKEANAKYQASLLNLDAPVSFVPVPTTGSDKFFCSLSQISEEASTRFSGWAKKKFTKVKNWFKTPFSEEFKDDLEDDNQDTPPSESN